MRFIRDGDGYRVYFGNEHIGYVERSNSGWEAWTRWDQHLLDPFPSRKAAAQALWRFGG